LVGNVDKQSVLNIYNRFNTILLKGLPKPLNPSKKVRKLYREDGIHEIQRIEKLLTTFNEGSETSLINRNAGIALLKHFFIDSKVKEDCFLDSDILKYSKSEYSVFMMRLISSHFLCFFLTSDASAFHSSFGLYFFKEKY
jgi:hypothetical protein